MVYKEQKMKLGKALELNGGSIIYKTIEIDDFYNGEKNLELARMAISMPAI